MHFFAAHPLLTGVLSFILGQVSLFLVLGLCGSAAARRDESIGRALDEMKVEPQPRRHRVRTSTRAHLQVT